MWTAAGHSPLPRFHATEKGEPRTTIFGTRGELSCEGHTIRLHDFLSDTTQVIDVIAQDQGMGTHAGGDYGLMDAFVSAVASDDPSLIRSGPGESLESHLMVFAAEHARREGRVVQLH